MKFFSVRVLLDSSEEIEELEELNNFAIKGDISMPTYYLDIDTQNQYLNPVIKQYLQETLGSEYEQKTPENADYKIKILNNFTYFGDLREISLAQNKFSIGEIKPYEAFIFVENNTINIIANNYFGFIAGTKELIKNYDSYLYSSGFKHIDAHNLDAIQIYDYIIKEGYSTKTFSNALRDLMYQQTEGTIPVQSPEGVINYRYRHLQPLKSDILKAYIDKDGYPVVMAGGLWSNIETWNDLGTELSNDGYDIYLIELTGGPESECDDCYNYPYEFLTDNVLPSYVHFILSDSEKSKIKYVGHSNGGRVMLDSLTRNSLSNQIVDTYVGAGVPGAFVNLSKFASIIKDSGNSAIVSIQDKGITHITLPRLAHELDSWTGEFVSLWLIKNPFVENNKLSLNTFKKYYYFINDSSDKQVGENLDLDYFGLIYGNLDSSKDDIIVHTDDEIDIFNNIISLNKVKFECGVRHDGMSTNIVVQKKVKEVLNKSIYENE